jgi:uncharacterized protein (DUF1330 family)
MKRLFVSGLTLLTGIAIGAFAVQAIHAQGKPKAYSVAELQIVDAAAVPAYAKAVQAAIKAAGGHIFNTAGGRVAGIVGAAPPARVAINEWDSLEAAEGFYKSKAWLDLAPQRDKAQKVIRLYAVEALQ